MGRAGRARLKRKTRTRPDSLDISISPYLLGICIFIGARRLPVLTTTPVALLSTRDVGQTAIGPLSYFVPLCSYAVCALPDYCSLLMEREVLGLER